MSYDNWKTTNPEDETLGEEFEPLEAEAPELPPIIAIYDPPPIPPREFDWCAHRDGREEEGPYGWGITREAAIADLLTAEADGF